MSVLSEAGLGALYALGSAVTWAVISLQVRRLAPILNSVTINAVRTSLSGGFLLGWVLVTQGTAELLAISPTAFALLVLSIAIATGIGDTAFFESSRSIGLTRAMTVSTTYPLIAAVLAAVLLGQLVSVRLPVAGALLALTPWARGGVARMRAGGRPLLVQMVVIGGLTIASSVLYVASIKHAGVAVATVLSSTAPMFAIPLGAMFLGERLTPRAVAGALVTVAGIAVLQL